MVGERRLHQTGAAAGFQELRLPGQASHQQQGPARRVDRLQQ